MNKLLSSVFGLALSVICSTISHANSLGRVLVVLPSAHSLSTREEAPHATGYFLSELIVPLKALVAIGIEPVFATPNGVVPNMDPISDDAKWFASQEDFDSAKQLLASFTGLRQPQALSSFNKRMLGHFDGLFIPGGHAAMEDLPTNKDLRRILKYFHDENKPTAAICHGPAALLSARNSDGSWIYSGYQMTVFSTAEEKQEEDAGALNGHVLYYVQDEFSRLGGLVKVAAPWSANAVKDRELITAQNPQSDKVLTPIFLQVLVEKVWNNRLSAKAQFIKPAPFARSQENIATLFIGTKRLDFTGNFLDRLERHTSLVRELMGDALLSYQVYAKDKIEIALMTWKNTQAKDAAFTRIGAQVNTDANQFLDSVLFEATELH